MVGTLRLIRIEDHETEGTFGVLCFNGTIFCCTLEPPDRDNESNRSCIPPGQYMARRYFSEKYGKTWQITNVPNRSYILIHAGNVVEHTKGCILVGEKFGKLKRDRAILNSGNTFKDFLRATDQLTELHVTITEAF